MDDKPAPLSRAFFQRFFIGGRKFQDLGEVPIANHVHHRAEMTPDFGAKRERFIVDLVHLQADKVRCRDSHAAFLPCQQTGGSVVSF
jgi:hypothetical protein